MPKGKEISLNFHTSYDKKTNNKIIRLTPLEVSCHRNYFYQKCFLDNGKKLLFAGEFDNNFNYYILYLDKEKAIQITEGEGDNTFGGEISSDEKYLYYVKNGANLNRVELSSLKEEKIFSSSKDWVSYGTWVTDSETKRIAGIEIHKDDYDPMTTWEAFIAMYHKKPLCRLFTVNLNTGEQKIILEDKCWFGHPIFRPFDKNTISFCHEGPHDLVDARIWFINSDGSNLRKFKEQEKGESCTHEFWVPNGSKMIYVSYFENENKGDMPPNRHIYSINPVTLENELIMAMPNCSHLMSNYDGTLLVGDGTCSPMDVANKNSHTIDTDNDLYVFNTVSKKYKSVGSHNSSWKVYKNSRQITHPHPSFTPDEKNIYYTSDYEGETAIYFMEKGEI